MQIYQSDALRVYHAGFSRSVDDISEIVVHGTGGGQNAGAMFSWISSGEFSRNWRQGIGLYHYLIDRNGDVYQMLDLNRWAYHSHAGQHDSQTIGIELINPDAGNQLAYTDHQYDSLIQLIKDVLIEHIPNIDRIVSHDFNCHTWSKITKTPPPCPGNFDWDRLRDLELIIKS